MEYVPKSLRPTKQKPRAVMYGIGIKDGDSYGMTHGPTKNVQRLLDEVGDANSCIIRFNIDGTDGVIWKWDGDRWVSVK